jgi:hypothetical protein
MCILHVCLGLGGCGGPARPHALGNQSEFSGSASAGVPFSDGGGTVLSPNSGGPPMCSLGPNGGVCACVDQPLLIDPPNLYFVLDRSGSMNADNKWPTVIATLGQLVVALGPRANLGAAVFPSPGGEAPDQCEAGVEVFPTRPGDSPAGRAGPTATTLLEVLGQIAAAGGTPTAATLAALAPHVEALPGKTFVILATDGGPNCDAALTCNVSDCQPNLEGDLGCPVAGPSCCTPDTAGAEACLDRDATVAAVTALSASGIPVYVVGVPGTGPYGQPGQVLDLLARAGGTARGSEPEFYQVTSTDQAALKSVLFRIAALATASCTLTLNNAPPDPSNVNVFLDEQPIAQAGPDGWTIDGQTVTIVGQSCARITSGSVLDVRVVAGCPTVLR